MVEITNGGSGSGGDTTDGTETTEAPEKSPLLINDRQAAGLGTLLAISGALVYIVNNPVDFIAGSLAAAVELAFGSTAKELLIDPVGFIIETVVVFIGSLVLEFMFAILNLILWFFLGADQDIGLGGGFPGIFDIPFFISVPVANAIYGLAFEIIAEISFFNRDFASQLEPLGIAAPAAANLIAVIEVGLLVWGGLIVARSIDVPFINLTGFISAVTAPVRRTFDWLFRR